MKRILNHIKHLVYKRKELKRLKLCLKVIENAKNYYIKKEYIYGMCDAFAVTLYTMGINHIPYRNWLGINIPEFNAKYLADLSKSHDYYWWDVKDIDSRIAAFDKLIKLYETKIKEL